jgi:flagellar basal body-associated protein FliL
MKKIIVIVVVLLLLAGGGFAVWKFVLSAGGGEAGQEGHGLSDLISSGPVFLDLDPFVVPVIRENRVVKYLSLGIKLELTGSAAENKVTEMMPYLRDAYLTRLHATLSRGDAALSSDVPKLKRQLMAESENLLGPDVVRDVLIGAVIEKEAPQQ